MFSHAEPEPCRVMQQHKSETGQGGGLAHSFRDPSGRVFALDGRILRIVGADAAADLDFLSTSPAVAAAVERGQLISTRRLDESERAALLEQSEVKKLSDAIDGREMLGHDRVAFPSYPYEWPPEMLYAAAELTLDLAEALLPEGMGLKDATPYNVLFRGAQPVFVDVLSIERRNPRVSVWLPYAQFHRTFLLPLLAQRYLGWRTSEVLLGRRDGLEPEDVYRASPFVRRWLPPFLTIATLPSVLAPKGAKGEGSLYQPRLESSPEKAGFILSSILRRLRRQLRAVRPVERGSQWSGYTEERQHYSSEDAKVKWTFVTDVLIQQKPTSVLDVGCNTGEFSLHAAEQSELVVAIDQDAAVVGALFDRAHADGLNILPLTVDFSRPTPATGWRNCEAAGFLERARGSFDMVMMLAVLHHLVVTERVPLEEILAVAAELTRSAVVIEFVAKDDPMFKRILRGREALFTWYDRERFERACAERFDIVRSEQLPRANRWLYLLEKKG